MPSRMGLIILARNIASYYKGVQPDGSFPSWDILKNIYDIAMASPPDWTTWVEPITTTGDLVALVRSRAISTYDAS